ncbi:MAG: DUF1178 family protein [Burkholderiaceae bacterium]|nr:DUF1178 family protein [Burkholderiaceae bacterium]
MKVLDLQCEHAHAFEGWFASEDDFQSQLARGLVTCPLCGNATISKKLSAPRLNLGAAEPASRPASAPPAGAGQSAATPPQPQELFMRMVRHVMENTEDVGERFAEEARRIHYGETVERGIRGQASREETEALLDEGIDVVPLPLPGILKGPLQ